MTESWIDLKVQRYSRSRSCCARGEDTHLFFLMRAFVHFSSEDLKGDE